MIKNVSIIGIGGMGRGIAQICAQGGYNITVRDLEEKALDTARTEIASNLQNQIKLGLLDEDDVKEAISKIKYTTSLEEALKDADLVLKRSGKCLILKKPCSLRWTRSLMRKRYWQPTPQPSASRRSGKLPPNRKEWSACTGFIQPSRCRR